jgi:hypothetical protein
VKWAIVTVIVLAIFYIILTALMCLGVTVSAVIKDLWEFFTGVREDDEDEEPDDVDNRP